MCFRYFGSGWDYPYLDIPLFHVSAVDYEDLLARYSASIDQIRLNSSGTRSGFTTPREFAPKYLPSVKNYSGLRLRIVL